MTYGMTRTLDGTAAQQIALKYGCSVVFPSFKDPEPNRQTLMTSMFWRDLSLLKNN